MFIDNFHLMHHSKWSLTELENMLPWERDVYIKQLQVALQKENDLLKNQKQI